MAENSTFQPTDFSQAKQAADRELDPNSMAPGELPPVRKPRHYMSGLLVVVVILAIVLPPSALAQWMALPIMALGLTAGLKFFFDSIASSKNSNPLVRSFIVIGGLGVGFVIFMVCFITGSIIAFAKDPHPEEIHCG